METSLHRELKLHYAGRHAQFEVPVGAYRVDVVSDGRLIEIQHGPLAAIRDKVRELLDRDDRRRVLVVKPIVLTKTLVKQSAKGGEVLQRRLSPKRGCLLDLFHELIHFTRVFPHRKLTLEVPLIEIEEWRYPGHGRRRRWRENDHEVEDQHLVAVRETHRFRTAADLMRLVACPLPRPFHTGDLAAGLGIDRWIAQRIAYFFRQIGALHEAGKRGNARLYEWRRATAAA
jgi:hypothetical protein